MSSTKKKVSAAVETDTDTDTGVRLDMKEIQADIAAGAKAYTELETHAVDDWNRWHLTIRGFRGLRSLVADKCGNSDVNSYAYRNMMSAMLVQRKYSTYDRIGKQVRSACYKLMDRLEEISEWHGSLSPDDQLRWKHPESVIKHCPQHMLGGAGSNKPPKKTPNKKKKPVGTAESERLQALLIMVIKRLIKYEPDAVELLDQVAAPASKPDPDDDLPDDLAE